MNVESKTFAATFNMVLWILPDVSALATYQLVRTFLPTLRALDLGKHRIVKSPFLQAFIGPHLLPIGLDESDAFNEPLAPKVPGYGCGSGPIGRTWNNVLTSFQHLQVRYINLSTTTLSADVVNYISHLPLLWCLNIGEITPETLSSFATKNSGFNAWGFI